MQIHTLQHVSIIVSDTARALAFYHDLLGIPLSQQRPPMAFPGAWLEISPQQQIHLLKLPNPEAGLERPAHGGRDRHFALGCDDLESLVQRLTTAGIAVSRSQSGRPALFCRDPDGNAVEIIQQQST